MKRITPLRQQYLDLKAQHPDVVLFFRLGDFYETFDGDAETAARELDLVLTTRPVGRDKRVPMAGVPFHSIDRYAAALAGQGHRVAIAEQIGEPNGSGLVERAVMRVIEPNGGDLMPADAAELRWFNDGRVHLCDAGGAVTEETFISSTGVDAMVDYVRAHWRMTEHDTHTSYRRP